MSISLEEGEHRLVVLLLAELELTGCEVVLELLDLLLGRDAGT